MAEKPVAVITGAGRGIGRAIALQLARQNYHVVLVSRTVKSLEQLHRQIGGGQVIPTDVSDVSQVQKMAAQVIDAHGRIDTIVNAAGYLSIAPLATMPLDAWHQTIETNISGTYYICRAFWPQMLKQKHGVIVNFSSPSAQDPYEGLGAYGVSKAAVETLGLVLAREGAAHGIAVHTISPSQTETEMFRQIFTKQQVPSSDILAPAEVAALAIECITGKLHYTAGSVLHIAKHP